MVNLIWYNKDLKVESLVEVIKIKSLKNNQIQLKKIKCIFLIHCKNQNPK